MNEKLLALNEGPHALTAHEVAELDAMSMPDATMALWLADMQVRGHGKMVRPEPDLSMFYLNDKGISPFIVGRTEDDRLFLGVSTDVGGWFLDVGWKAVSSVAGQLILHKDMGGKAFSVVLPVKSVVFQQLPRGEGQIEISILDLQKRERVRTVAVPYRYQG
ncbi:MAG: hypothetical protein CVV05_01075 [Gammaproteobacteria bacterium HGW-Gammaproteobacteria-1]|nr:MAG: hypothetical protein CVV05_01075 [Gammaproteobacteria bacterium HGW-Gammaproteobacteria-1]